MSKLAVELPQGLWAEGAVLVDGDTGIPVPNDSGGSHKSSIIQTTLPLSGVSQEVVPVNLNRKYLAWMVIGTVDVTVSAGINPAVFGQGMIYQASGLNKQGGSEDFSSSTPTSAFYAVSPSAGSILVIWEGI